ncbi:Ceramide glucosyltransferase [Thecaphora frezii]
MWALVAWLCLAWYVTIWSICLTGLSLARRYFLPPVPRSPLSPPQTSSLTANTASRRMHPAATINNSSLDNNDDDQDESSKVPGVSILRPLSGLDCNLYSNLASSFLQDYPASRFEVLLSIREIHTAESRKVHNVARMVMAQYPHVRARIIVGDEEAGVNPKINNLVRPYAQARFDILWVVDSQVSSPPGALARAVDELSRTHDQHRPLPTWLKRKPHGTRVGLVHHVPLAVLPGDGWGSHVERVFLSTTHAKMYLAINAFAIDSCVMGKSNMYRKSDLERVPDAFFEVGKGGSRGERGAIGSAAFGEERDGGEEDEEFGGQRQDEGGETQRWPLLSSRSASSSPISRSSRPSSLSSAPATTDAPSSTMRTTSRALARFAIYLAEDNMLALSLWRAPLSLSHSVARGDVARTAVGDVRTLRDYAQRRMRWIRVRKHMVLAATLVEPLTESVVAGAMGLVAFRRWIAPGSGWGAAAAFLAGHWIAWFCTDLGVMKALQAGNGVGTEEWYMLVAAWITREVLAVPIWAWAVAGSCVQWRGKPYRVLADGRAAAISTPS